MRHSNTIISNQGEELLPLPHPGRRPSLEGTFRIPSAPPPAPYRALACLAQHFHVPCNWTSQEKHLSQSHSL